MFCTKCGSEIPDGSAFCTECGAPADSTPGSSPAPAAKGNPAIESAPKGSGRPFPLSDWFSFRGRMARKEWWIRTLILLFFLEPRPHCSSCSCFLGERDLGASGDHRHSVARLAFAFLSCGRRVPPQRRREARA
nr:zinc-ribbon domain-containing protein [Succinivibrionaceae bacterium]